MEEKTVFVRVFVPYHQYHHMAYYYYDENEYGRHLPFGTIVCTSMGVGAVISDNVSIDKLPEINIQPIFRLADSREAKYFEKDWWSPIQEILHGFSKYNET